MHQACIKPDYMNFFFISSRQSEQKDCPSRGKTKILSVAQVASSSTTSPSLRSTCWSALEQDESRENKSRARALTTPAFHAKTLPRNNFQGQQVVSATTAKADHSNAEISDLIKEQLLLLLSAVTTVALISIQMVSLPSET